jgi:WD40 repeat protein
MDDAGPTVSASARAVGPYIGLRFFTEQDAEWFFGREEEHQTIIANLRATRLTILYARSGVGKSSLLRAGVARQLGDLAHRWLAERGSPRYVPVVFGAWKDDPVEGLITAIEDALRAFLPARSPPTLPRGQLRGAIEAATASVDATLLIILDQFEEYLLYSAREPGGAGFVDQMAGCLNRPEVRANFLIAIREDAYAGLGDLFAGKAANVYGNYLQLGYLDRDAAREAIVRPIEHFNRRHAAVEPMTLEPALIDSVLDEVRSGEVQVGVVGRGAVEDGNGHLPRREEIETPYLQLVMSTIWRRERERQSHVLRLATLRELGGAQEIVRAHLDGALRALGEDERDTALDVFQHLVTPSGAKIVHAASDLALMVDRPGEQVAGLLAKLAQGDTRIVRQVPPPAGKSQPDDRYEIFHDVLAPAIVAWRQRALEQQRAAEDSRERQRLERERRLAQERAQQEARRRRSFQRLAAAALALLLVAIVLGVLAFLAQRSAVSNQKTAQSRQLAASAEATLPSDPELSTLLALQALRVKHTTQAEAALRDAVPQMGVLKALPTGSLLFSASFSPDGRRVLTSSADGTARVWDAASGSQLISLHPPGRISGAAFSSDGRRIVASTEKGAVIWDSRNGSRLAVLGPGRNVEVAAFSPDGTKVVTAGYDKRTSVWDVGSGRQLAVFPPAKGAVRTVVFSPDGGKVLTASEDGAATVWGVASRKQLLVVHATGESIDAAAFSPDGAKLVTAGTGGTVRIWDVGSAKQLAVLNGHSGTVYSAAFSPDGSQVLTASEDGTARIWDVASARQLNALSSDTGAVRGAAFSPDGTRVVTASEDGTARIWDASPRELRVVLDKSLVNSASFSPDESKVVTAGYDGRARIWRAATGKQLVELKGHTEPLTSAAFSHDGTRVVTASEDGTARIWDASSGAQLAVFSGPEARVYGLLSAAFSPDGTRVVTASEDGTARIWRLKGSAPAIVLGQEGHIYRIYAAAFSPDGKQVVTASEDGSARVWDAASGTQVALLSPGRGIILGAAFSPSGRELVIACADGTARIFDAASGHQLVVLSGHSGPVTGVAFSNDGRKVVTAGADGTVRIWDAASGQQLAVLRGQAGRVNSAAFSGDGHSVVTASDHMTAIWSAELSGSITSLQQIAESRVTRQLTRQERRAYGVGG